MENQLVKKIGLIVVIIFLVVLINPFSCGDSQVGKGVKAESKDLTMAGLQKNIVELQKGTAKKIAELETKFNLRLIQYFVVFMVLFLIGLVWTAHYYKKLLLGKKSVKKVTSKTKKPPVKKKVVVKKDAVTK